MRNKWLIDRRTCLKGLGAALALPLLESMGWAETPPKGAGAWKPPVRLGFMYMPHGVIMSRFWPKDAAAFRSGALPPIIASLAPVRDRCLMVKGISGVPIAPFNGAPHALELSTWLTATLPDPDRRASIHIGISADQIAANYVGGMTALPSLELATMPQTHKENQEGLNENYYSHCSFRSPTQPVPAEVNPGAVFRRLFQGTDRGPANANANAQALSTDGELDRSLLDLVLGGAKDLRGRLGRADQQKIDEYLDGVRALERRIASIEHRQREGDKAGDARRRDGDSPLIDVAIPDGDVKGNSPEKSQFVRRTAEGESEVKRSEYMQVMCDLMLLAFQADITRVATYIGSTPNGVSYPELGFSDQHHSQTHYGTDQVKIDKVAKINALNVEQFAYMVTKMANLKEGAGTLLDNCIMMWGSGLEDGDKHERKNLPFVIAGKGGGTLNTGRFITDVKANQGDLLGTLLTAAGIPLDRPIGIGSKVITEMLNG